MDTPHQVFEFLLRLTQGTEVFVYCIPCQDADRLADVFTEFEALAADRGFVEFSTIGSRFILLNRNFIVGVVRRDLVIRKGDDGVAQIAPHAGKLAGWESLNDPNKSPDLALFLDGLEEPVVCSKVARDELELAAAVLEAEPITAVLTFTDEVNLVTRFIPTRQVIVWDSIKYPPANPE